MPLENQKDLLYTIVLELEKKWRLGDNEAKEKWRQAENIENVSQQWWVEGQKMMAYTWC